MRRRELIFLHSKSADGCSAWRTPPFPLAPIYAIGRASRQQPTARPDQHRSANSGHPRNDRGFLPTRQDGRPVPCAAGGMGFLRDRSEFRDLEAEPIARLWVHLKYLNQHTAIAALAHGTRN